MSFVYPGGGFPMILPQEYGMETPRPSKPKGFSPYNIKSIKQIVKSKNTIVDEEQMNNLISSEQSSEHRGGGDRIDLKYLKMINRLPK